MTKKEKREKKKKDRGIVDFIMIYKHFFKDMQVWINYMEDPRNPSYTIYTQTDFVNMGILKNICSLKSMRQMEEDKTKKTGIGKEKGTGCYYNHMEKLAGKSEVMNVYEYSYEKKTQKGNRKIRFQWITNIEVRENNLEEMTEAGRGRWNNNAMKNHYLLTQIADILMQLYLAWCPLIKEIKQSIKNTSSRLLESFRIQTVTDEDVLYIERYTSVYRE